ncbi:MAG: hypothetical protein QW331_02645 [Candidatus Woesearchaeota archaeon]
MGWNKDSFPGCVAMEGKISYREQQKCARIIDYFDPDAEEE